MWGFGNEGSQRRYRSGRAQSAESRAGQQRGRAYDEANRQEAARLAQKEADMDLFQRQAAVSPMAQTRARMYEMMETPIGQGYESSAFYKNEMSKIGQEMKRRGYISGAQQTASGLRGTGGGYGAGQGRATQQFEAEGRLRLAAASQAEQQQAARQMQDFNRHIQALGYEKGVEDARFQQWYLKERMALGVSEAEANRELQEMQMWLGLGGQILGVGAKVAGLFL